MYLLVECPDVNCVVLQKQKADPTNCSTCQDVIRSQLMLNGTSYPFGIPELTGKINK